MYKRQLLYLGQRPVGITVTQAELDLVVEKLGVTWSAINNACASDEFEPRTGPLCGWCPYLERCPEGSSEVAKRRAAREAEAEAFDGNDDNEE